MAAEAVGVWTVLVASERVVESSGKVLASEHEGRVLCPAQAEETSHEVLGRFDHAALRGGSRYNFAAVVGVQMTVVVLVQSARREELFFSYWHQNLLSELVVPAVQEAEVPGESNITEHASSIVLELCGQGLDT